MLIIEHRKNTIEEVKRVPESHGVEVDLRSWGNKLILQHEPFCEGEAFEEWLDYFHHAFLVLNIKEEGIESRVQALLDKKNIKEYFYLDVSFPFIVKLIKSGQKNIALRFSEYESIETCLSLAGKADWVWVDYFNNFPLDAGAYKKLSVNFKICLVSSELLGRDEEVAVTRNKISGMDIQAVCTKIPEKWA